MTKDQLKKFIVELGEENQTLKDNVEFLHSCLDDRDKSIELMKEKIEKLEKELSAAYKAYHTALGVDYVSEEDLYDLND